MLEVRFGPWGVMGVNLTAPSLADILDPQDCLYSRTLRQDARVETRIIGALRQVIDVTDKVSADRAIAALGGPDLSGATPLTLISCDNVPSNGARLEAAMLKFAALRSAALTRWIEDRVSFPCTMGERIVPATTPEDVDKVSPPLGARAPAA